MTWDKEGHIQAMLRMQPTERLLRDFVEVVISNVQADEQRKMIGAGTMPPPADSPWEKRIRADERERCARIVEERHQGAFAPEVRQQIAAAIRAGAPDQPNASGGHTKADPAWEEQFSQPDMDPAAQWKRIAEAAGKNQEALLERAEAAEAQLRAAEAKVRELEERRLAIERAARELHEVIMDSFGELGRTILAKSLSPAPAPVIDLEKRANEMMLERDVALRRVALLEEAFMWTGGSADFAPGGQAYVGWMKWRDELGLSPTPAQQEDKE